MDFYLTKRRHVPEDGEVQSNERTRRGVFNPFRLIIPEAVRFTANKTRA
jgi:hypothetical protein